MWGTLLAAGIAVGVVFMVRGATAAAKHSRQASDDPGMSDAAPLVAVAYHRNKMDVDMDAEDGHLACSDDESLIG